MADSINHNLANRIKQIPEDLDEESVHRKADDKVFEYHGEVVGPKLTLDAAEAITQALPPSHPRRELCGLASAAVQKQLAAMKDEVKMLIGVIDNLMSIPGGILGAEDENGVPLGERAALVEATKSLTVGQAKVILRLLGTYDKDDVYRTMLSVQKM